MYFKKKIKLIEEKKIWGVLFKKNPTCAQLWPKVSRGHPKKNIQRQKRLNKELSNRKYSWGYERGAL